MLARMVMSIDTIWGNKLELSVAAELDNPHLQTTREISTLMVHNLRVMVEEARATNEQTLLSRVEDARRGSEENAGRDLGRAPRGDEADRDV